MANRPLRDGPPPSLQGAWEVEVNWRNAPHFTTVRVRASEWADLVKAVENRTPWAGKFAALPSTTNVRALRITRMDQ